MKRFSVRFFAAALWAATMYWVPSGYAARAYFTDQPAVGSGLIIAVALDGTSQQTVAVASNTPDVRGIAFHRSSGRIFFLDNGAAKKIYSILPDGSDQQEIAPLTGSLNADLEI